jgi:3-dehydroquinate dehydratase
VLLGTTDLLGTVLLFLALLASGFGGGSKTLTDQAIFGFESLERIDIVVNESETGRFGTTEISLETENNNGFLVDRVHFGNLLTNVSLGAVGQTGMDDVQDHLLTSQQTVGHELTSTKSNRRSVSL